MIQDSLPPKNLTYRYLYTKLPCLNGDIYMFETSIFDIYVKFWEFICKVSIYIYIFPVTKSWREFVHPLTDFDTNNSSDLCGEIKKHTPWKINIELGNAGLEDDFPFPGLYSQVPC